MFGQFVRLAEENEFAYVVTLVTYRPEDPIIENNYICSGSLITMQDVLTAGHCLENLQPHQVLIYAGSIDITNSLPYSIFRWISYNMYARINNIEPEFPVNDISNIRVHICIFNR
jgi:secreted trypsin-like serine protease